MAKASKTCGSIAIAPTRLDERQLMRIEFEAVEAVEADPQAATNNAEDGS